MKRGVLAALVLVLAAPVVAQDKPVPYWASIASGEAMMRTGPGKNYPGVWLYKRRDLPIRVLKRHESWRLIEDPEGARGWMLVAYRAEPGVVGRIDDCTGSWCHIRIGKREGHVRTSDIWGVDEGEVVD